MSSEREESTVDSRSQLIGYHMSKGGDACQIKRKKQGTNISRRRFLKGVGTGTVAATVAPAVLIGSEETAEAQQDGGYR